jgi:shikimate dehydrogenase
VTRWACLLGQPVAHSLSPALHNAAFAALGLDVHYEARDVAPDALAATVGSLRSADCLGANVTAPHKAAVVPFMDALREEVRALGVVNTIVNRDGRLEGGNTDAAGLQRWMRLADIDAAGSACLVLGAGGAARSAVWALAQSGAASVVVLNRTVDRAETLVNTFREQLPHVGLRWGNLAEAARPSETAYRVVINATSLAYYASAPEVHPSCYSRDSVAIELAYNPPETLFMARARETGARVENGLGMLLHQAALAFERWTGQAPPMDIYAAVVSERVAA